MSIDLVATTIAAIMWCVLAIYGFVTVHKWNKRFAELHDLIKCEMEEQR